MEGKVVITHKGCALYYGYYKDGVPCELYAQNKENESLVGNIYLARVERVADGIHGAFLEIADGKCYYPFSEHAAGSVLRPQAAAPIKGGDLILIQIMKDSSGSKLPAGGSNLSFTGRYLVLTVSDRRDAVSAKIRDKRERDRLKGILNEFHDDRFGVIMRTNAAGKEEDTLRQEYGRLKEQYETVISKAQYAAPRTLLYKAPDNCVTLARELPDRELKEVITDDPDIYRELKDYYKNDIDKGLLNKIRYYEDDYPLYKLYRMEHYYSEAMKRQVYMGSGAFLVIDYTEAMTVIDVNSGSVIKNSKKKEDLFFRINIEACEEIARQVRLRNISGIIVVDFINMKSEERKNQVLLRLRECCAGDRSRVRVVDMTPLGLVEMTRTKSRPPLREQLKDFC